MLKKIKTLLFRTLKKTDCCSHYSCGHTMDDTDADRDDYFYIRRYTAGRRHQVEVSYHKKCLFEKFLFDYAIEGKISWDEYRSIYDILFSDDDPITEKGIPSGPETEWPSLPDPSLFGG